MRVVGSPLVQLGLDLQYPPLGLIEVGPRRVGVHQRPPGIPVLRLRTRWVPSPCGRLSRPRTTTDPPSRCRVISRRRAVPLPARLAGSEATRKRFPRSPLTVRRDRCPAFPCRHVHGYPAALHRGPRHHHGVEAVPPGCKEVQRTAIPAIHQVHQPVRLLEGVPPPVSALVHLSVRLPDPGRLVVPTRPGVVGAAPALLPSRDSGCPQPQRPAATGHRWVLAPHPVTWRLVAHPPVGRLERHLGVGAGLGHSSADRQGLVRHPHHRTRSPVALTRTITDRRR